MDEVRIQPGWMFVYDEHTLNATVIRHICRAGMTPQHVHYNPRLDCWVCALCRESWKNGERLVKLSNTTLLRQLLGLTP